MRKRKGDINPNPGFKKELKEYEKVPLVARPIVSPLRVSGITLRQARSGCSIG